MIAVWKMDIPISFLIRFFLVIMAYSPIIMQDDVDPVIEPGQDEFVRVRSMI